MDTPNKDLNIEIPEDIAPGKYANLAVITHSQSEFIIDFIGMLPGVPRPKVHSRIIMTPDHAKRLMNALADNLRRYEDQFGDIDMGKAIKGTGLPPMGFGGNTAQA